VLERSGVNVVHLGSCLKFLEFGPIPTACAVQEAQMVVAKRGKLATTLEQKTAPMRNADSIMLRLYVNWCSIARAAGVF
jgi:hypothetical protein